MPKQVAFTLLVILSLLLQSCITPSLAAPRINTTPSAGLSSDHLVSSPAASRGQGNQPAHTPSASPAPPNPLQGSLRLPVELETDHDPTTNPSPAQPVGMVRISAGQAIEPLSLAEVTLGVEVVPHDANQNPAGALVTIHIWNQTRSADLTEQLRADAWGAASASFTMLQAGDYFYQASAPGYGQTPVRSFRIDPGHLYTDMQLGAAALTTHIADDGKLIADVQTPFVMDDDPLAIELDIFRLTAQPGQTTSPKAEMLPPEPGQRLSAHRGQVQAVLEPGNYMVMAKVNGGQVRAFSEPALVHVPAGRHTQPSAATTTQPTPSLDSTTPRKKSHRTILQTWRAGAFKWRTTEYSATIETVVDDGKKLVTIDDFSYEPVARRYTIGIQSLMTTTVQDKVTVEIFGPNGVVIYEETSPIVLEAGQLLRYDVKAPADRGEPYGLRVTVHDPSILQAFFQTVNTGLTTAFGYLNAKISGTIGGSISLGIKLEGSLTLAIVVKFISVLISCQYPSTGDLCLPPKIEGLLITGSLGDIRTELEKYLIDKGILVVKPGQPTSQAFDALLETIVNGIPLAIAEVKALPGIRYTRPLIDPQGCVSQAALDAAKKQVEDIGSKLDLEASRLNGIFDDFRRKQEATVVLVPLGFSLPLSAMALELTGSAALTLKAGATQDSYGLEFDFGPEFGAKGSLLIKLFSALAVGQGIYRLGVLSTSLLSGFQIVQGAYSIIQVIKDAANLKIGGGCASGGGGGGGNTSGGGKGGNNPPPPGGFPDDRRDPPGLEFLATPLGLSGNIQTLQQQVVAARTAGLTRAEKFYTYELRKQELGLFAGDAIRFTNYVNDILRISESASLTITGLVSGTILPPPGVTITDAMQSVYDQAIVALTNTSYDRELQTLNDARAFAERRYFELRGQELELQLELRQLTGGIAVLDSGLTSWALAAVGTVGVQPKLIHLLPGQANTFGSTYVSPLAAPPVLIVPTGGLNRYQGSDQARDWLEQYVFTGGTLLVLTQYENADWELLPGGQVKGLGYLEDILCKEASVQIINPSVWISGVDRDLPDIQIDGSFTEWPSNATILWMRTTGNQKPAMLEYPYGAGQVVATAAYPDFYINGMQSTDDIIFARSLFSVAYLRANNLGVAATVAPNTPLTLDLPLANTLATTVTQTLLTRDAYDRRISDAWRWAAHAPSLGNDPGQTTLNLNPGIPSGGVQNLAYNFVTPNRAGIYHIGGVAYGNTGHFNFFGDFYQVRSSVVAVDLTYTRLTQDQPDYPIGSTATLTVTLRNDRAIARTFVITPESGLSAPVVTLNVPANGTVTQNYTTVVNNFREVRLRVAADGRPISTLVTNLELRRPTLGLTVNPLKLPADLDDSVQATVTARSASPGAPVKFTVTRSGATVREITAPLAVVDGYQAAVANLNLPAAPAGVVYTLRVELDDLPCGIFACVIRQAIPVAAIATVHELHYSGAPLQFNQPNPDALVARINGSEFPGAQRLDPLFQINGSTVTTGAAVQGPASNAEQNITLSLPLPNSLPLDQPLRSALLFTTRASGATVDNTATVTLPFTLKAPVFSVLDPVRLAGDPLNMQLTAPTLGEINLPIPIPPSSPLTVSINGPDGFIQQFVVTNATATDNLLNFDVTVPTSIVVGGLYEVSVATPHLSGWTGRANFQVPLNALSFDALPALPVGQNAAFAIRNNGGVPTLFNGTVRLVSASGVTLATTSVNGALAVRSTLAGNLAIPSQLRAGGYQLLAAGVNHRGEAVTFALPVTLNGLQVALKVDTDRIAYLTSDQVNTTNLVTSNLPLDSATLRLRVIKPGGDVNATDEWRANRGDAGNRNFANANFALPFSPAWNIGHSTFSVGNPLSVGGLIVVVDSAAQTLQGRAGADGQLLWETPYTPYGFSVYSLAANSNRLFALVDNNVVALDLATGAVQWSQRIGDNANAPLLVSDSALAVLFIAGGGGDALLSPNKGKSGLAAPAPQIGISNGYLLLDPATGALLNTIEQTAPAVLVNNQLSVYQGDSVAAYDATTGANLWTTPVATFLNVFAANNSYLLAHDSNAQALQLFDAASGAFLRSVPLDSNFSPNSGLQNTVLNGGLFHYASLQFGSGANGVIIYRVDLASGDQTPIFNETSFEFRGLLGAGGQLHLLREAPRALLVLDPATGANLGERDLGDLTDFSLTGLIVAPDGPAVVTDANLFVYTATSGGGAPAGLQILREELLSVSGAGVIPVNHSLINPSLSADPRARGQLYLDGAFFASEPQSIADPTQRQLLAVSRSSFTIDNASAALTLLADQSAVRQNIANYAADDAAATVTLRGQARNTSALASDINVTVQRSDGATLFTRNFPNVAPNATVDFSFGDAIPPVGAVSYSAATNLGGAASTTLIVRPPDLNASVSLAPLSIALSEATVATLVLQNRNNDVPSFVTVNWGSDGPESLVLQQGETITRTHTFTPSAAGPFNPPVVLSGDANTTLQATAPITVRDETVNVAAQISGVTRDPATLVLSPDASVTFSVTNRNVESFDVAVSYVINSPQLTGSAVLPLNPLETKTINVPVNSIGLGAHNATFAVQHGRTGATLGVANLAFELAAAQNNITLDAQVGDPAPNLDTPILINVSSAANSDLPWRGVLVLEGALTSRNEFTVNPGQNYTLAPSVALSQLSGPQTVTITLFGPDGAILAQRTLTLNGALRQASAARLVSLSATPGAAGGPITLTLLVDNPGPAGEEVIEFAAFDQVVQQMVQLPANSQSSVTQVINVPPGLISGLFPATASLGEQGVKTDMTVNGAQLEITQSLDAPTYLPFSNATYTVRVRGVSGAAAQYDVVLRYAGQELLQTISVGAGQTRNVVWNFNVGQVSERATVLVRTHPNTPTQPRYTLIVDSIWVRVIEDDRAYLESDRNSYNAGDTVNLTIHLLQPVNNAFVTGPEDAPNAADFLVWSGLEAMNANNTIGSLAGDFTASYPLPQTMRTGRYFFRLFFDGEERTLPIDVQGVNILVEEMAVAIAPTVSNGGALATVNTTINASLRLNQGLPNALVETYALTPNGDYRSLGAPASRSFTAGVNSLSLTGVFTTETPGGHQIVFKVRDATTFAELGGEARFVDVGGATITSLRTDHGVYSPGSQANGEVTLYNTATAQVTVRTSGGNVLLNQAVSQRGHVALTFRAPTATAMDEVLIGEVTDSTGMKSTLQWAYKVAASFDLTPPQVQITAPAPSGDLTDVTRLQYTALSQLTINVAGTATDNRSVTSVTVNGIAATLNGDNWSAPVTLLPGSTFLEVVASDAAGNLAYATHMVVAEPAYGVTFNLTPTTLDLGDAVQMSAVVTASDLLTVAVTFPFSKNGFAPISGNASSGLLDLNLTPSHPEVTWQGVVSPGSGVTINWSATAMQPHADSAYAYAQADGFEVAVSNRVDYLVNGGGAPTPPETTISGQPANLSTSGEATFTFTGADDVGVARFECSLDNSAFATCGSPQDYSGLADGNHTFQVRAVDLAGAVDPTPAAYSWTVRVGTPVAACGGYQVYQGRNGAHFAFGWNGTIKVGNKNNNTLIGSNGPDLILGLGGNDKIDGKGGDDLLCSGDGVDLVLGLAGNDLLDGGLGNDVLNGGSGDFDELWAGDGHDVLLDGDGVLQAQGGAGNDLLTLALRNGWRDPNGQPRFSGLAAGYGNDAVGLAILNTTRFLVDITGDERDHPPSPLEGANDALALGGVIDPASLIIKFEKQVVISATATLQEPLSIPSEEDGAEHLSEPVGDGTDDGATQKLHVFLPLVVK